MYRPVSPVNGPLRDYELAFLREGSVLVRDDGRTVILMWLTR